MPTFPFQSIGIFIVELSDHFPDIGQHNLFLKVHIPRQLGGLPAGNLVDIFCWVANVLVGEIEDSWLAGSTFFIHQLDGKSVDDPNRLSPPSQVVHFPDSVVSKRRQSVAGMELGIICEYYNNISHWTPLKCSLISV